MVGGLGRLCTVLAGVQLRCRLVLVGNVDYAVQQVAHLAVGIPDGYVSWQLVAGHKLTGLFRVGHVVGLHGHVVGLPSGQCLLQRRLQVAHGVGLGYLRVVGKNLEEVTPHELAALS